MEVRVAARANIVLGLAIAAMALLAGTINAGEFHAPAQVRSYRTNSAPPSVPPPPPTDRWN
jgi:hypothetical protein